MSGRQGGLGPDEIEDLRLLLDEYKTARARVGGVLWLFRVGLAALVFAGADRVFQWVQGLWPFHDP